VKSLKLPLLSDPPTQYNGKNLHIASWGRFSNSDSVSDTLRKAEMEVISRETCETFFPPPLITQSVICTASSHCSGDSGAILVDKDDAGEFLAVGIASFAYGSCREGWTRPSVFMRISSYLSFIESNLDLTLR
jgi:secreted trypsin-like serine protease